MDSIGSSNLAPVAKQGQVGYPADNTAGQLNGHSITNTEAAPTSGLQSQASSSPEKPLQHTSLSDRTITSVDSSPTDGFRGPFGTTTADQVLTARNDVLPALQQQLEKAQSKLRSMEGRDQQLEKNNTFFNNSLNNLQSIQKGLENNLDAANLKLEGLLQSSNRTGEITDNDDTAFANDLTPIEDKLTDAGEILTNERNDLEDDINAHSENVDQLEKNQPATKNDPLVAAKRIILSKTEYSVADQALSDLRGLENNLPPEDSDLIIRMVINDVKVQISPPGEAFQAMSKSKKHKILKNAIKALEAKSATIKKDHGFPVDMDNNLFFRAMQDLLESETQKIESSKNDSTALDEQLTDYEELLSTYEESCSRNIHLRVDDLEVDKNSKKKSKSGTPAAGEQPAPENTETPPSDNEEVGEGEEGEGDISSNNSDPSQKNTPHPE